jgi:hypothetical protein
MMDHSHDHGAVDGPWAGGWLVAVAAGLIAAFLARWLGGAEMSAAGFIGVVVFGVYAVLLGNGGVELTVTEDHGADHGHGHGHH